MNIWTLGYAYKLSGMLHFASLDAWQPQLSVTECLPNLLVL